MTIAQPLTLTKASAAHTNSGTLTVAANFTLSQSGTTPSFTSTGTITVAGGVTLSVISGAFNYNSGAIGGLGTIDFSSATLGLTPGLTNDTLHLSFTNSTVNGPGTLSNAANATLFLQNTAVNAPMANSGLVRARSNTAFNATLSNGGGATLRIEGDASCCTANVTVASGFTNFGAIELTAISGSGTTSQLNVTNGTLTNAATGTISVLVGNGGARTLAAQLANQGTVTIAQPLTLSKASAAHTNTGTLAVAANLSLNQTGTTPSFTNTGTITVALGATMSVSAGAFNYTSGAIGGLGTIDFVSATLDMTPNFTNDTLHLSFTNSTVKGSGILGNAAGATLVVQNTAVNTGMGNQGLLRARSNTSFNGALSNTGSAIFRIEGDASCCTANVTVANAFTNNAAIELTAINGSGTSSQLNVTSGILTNASSASIKSLPGNGGARTLAAQVDNQGTMSISQAMTLTFPAAGQVNSGLIQLTGGDLTVVLSGFRPGFANDAGGVIDVGTNKLVINNQSTGTFLNNAGGTLRGAGTIDIGTASFITNGTTTVGGASPGFLNFAGTYMQGPSPSELNVRIGGDPAKPGVDYDQLNVVDGGTQGNAVLQGGFLNLTVGANTQGKTYVIIQLPAGRTFTGSLGQINIVSGFCDVVSPTGPVGNQFLLTCS